MKTVERIDAVRNIVSEHRNDGLSVAFVATMGNLHEGHMELVECARRLGGTVVVSLYVNPYQFAADEDLSTYPRTLDADKEALLNAGVDLLFLPNDQVMYPRGQADHTTVEVPGLGKILEGETRPTFFRGVTTVVARLFNIVQPDVAFFGKKDFQQLVIIRRMVEDLSIPVSIAGVETVRGPDGLALSSRNNYLDRREKAIAPGLYRALNGAAAQLVAGEKDFAAVETKAKEQLIEAGLIPDYLEIRRRADLDVPDKHDRGLVILGAAKVGKTRLIDNIEVEL